MGSVFGRVRAAASRVAQGIRNRFGGGGGSTRQASSGGGRMGDSTAVSMGSIYRQN